MKKIKAIVTLTGEQVTVKHLTAFGFYEVGETGRSWCKTELTFL